LRLADGTRQHLAELGVGSCLLLVIPQRALLEEPAEAFDRVTLAPCRDLLPRAVARIVVGRGVAAVAVDEVLDEGRPEAVPGTLYRLTGDVVRSQHVHAVYVVTGHAVGVGLDGDVLGAGLVTEVDADGVPVVLAGE